MKRRNGVIAITVMSLAMVVLSVPDESAAISIIQMGATDTVQFATGGVGQGERDEMMKMADNFNLKLVFASSSRYLSDVGVVIRKPGGDLMLAADSNGPWMFVNLPAGGYVVETKCRGVAKTANVQVGRGLRTVVFDWKAKDGM